MNIINKIINHHNTKAFSFVLFVIIAGGILGASFLAGYLDPEPTIFYGQLLGSIITILLGSLLIITSIMLFSMANLIKDKN